MSRYDFGLKKLAQVMNGSDGNGGTVSTNTPVVSTVIPCFGMPYVSLQLIATLNLAGTWKIEESNDYSATPGGPVSSGRWCDVTAAKDFLVASPPTITAAPGSGVAQNLFVRLNPASRRALRVTFTQTGGTGVPEVWATATQA
jgi:hypothetical protein